jgi:hypothetical protein
LDVRTWLVAYPGTAALTVFVLLGWSYYMASRALMSGALFAEARRAIDRRASEGERVFEFLSRMLGCLMCTALELSLWTLGLLTLAFGLYFRLGERVASALVAVAGGGRAATGPVPLLLELAVVVGAALAVSFAVAGEAWAIKTVVEHREARFLALRDEYRAREQALRERIVALTEGSREPAAARPRADGRAIISLDEFVPIHARLDESCPAIRCPFTLARCRLERMGEALRVWGERIEGGAGEVYSLVILDAVRRRDDLYWSCWDYRRRDAAAVHAILVDRVRSALDRAA